MATIKIFQVRTGAKTPQDLDVSGALLPLSASTALGKSISTFGQAVEKVALENKAEDDANEASDIITGINAQITNTLGKYKRSTNANDVIKYGNDLDNLEFEASNKSVQKLVDNYISKKKNSTSLSLGKEILNRSIKKSEDRKDKELDSYIGMATSDNALDRIKGNRLCNKFFGSPENFQFYGEKKLREIKKKKDLLYLKNIYIKGIDNREIDIFDNKTREKILSTFGEVGGKKILEKARNKLITDVTLDEDQQRTEERTTNRQQLNNFSVILDNINNSRTKGEALNVTMDQIYDLYQIQSINTAQYNALLKFYTSDTTFDDAELANVIDVQIAAASTVSDLDDIQAALNNDKDILENVPPDQVVEFNKIIEKYRGDTKGFNDYKLYHDKLKADLNTISIYVYDKSGKAAEQKTKALIALQSYNGFINDGKTPQDAYIETISTFAEKDLPKPELLPMPFGFTIKDFKQTLNKNPDGAQEIYEKRIITDLKEGRIDIRTFKEGIKRLDFMFDVLAVRKDIYGADTIKNNKLAYLGGFGTKVKKDE